MQRSTLNKEELIKILERLSLRLQDKHHGMLPQLAPVFEKNIIETVAEKMMTLYGGEMPKEALNNASIQKAMALALVSETVSRMNPNFKFDYENLFKPGLKPKDMKDPLKQLLLQLNKLTPQDRRLKDEEIDKYVDNLIKFCEETEEETLGKNERFVDILSEIMTECLNCLPKPKPGISLESENLRELYGGVDPTMTGSIAIPIYRIDGNLMNLFNLAPGYFTSGAFMDEKNRADPGKYDPTSAEAQTIKNEISNGSMTAGLTSYRYVV